MEFQPSREGASSAALYLGVGAAQAALAARQRAKTTLAEAFHDHGFATGAFICNNLLTPENRFERGAVPAFAVR